MDSRSGSRYRERVRQASQQFKPHRLIYERRIAIYAILAALPGMVLGMALVWTQPWTRDAKIALTVLVLVLWFILTLTARPARRVGPRRITSINATLGPVSRATSTSPRARARARAAAGIARPRRPRLATAVARCSSGAGGATGCGLGRRHPVILLAHRL